MPFKQEWVDPEVAVDHKGITVYHVYRDDDLNEPMDYHFTLDPGVEYEDMDWGAPIFDVRELPGWKPCRRPPALFARKLSRQERAKREKAWQTWMDKDTELKHVRKFLKHCIDQGIIRPEGVYVDGKRTIW